MAVDDGVFLNCSELIKIEILLVLTGTLTFCGCSNLKCVLLANDIPYGTFKQCQNLKEIHWYGFENNNAIVKTNNFFTDCNNLRRLYLYFDFVEFDEKDLQNLKNVDIYCEDTCNAADLAFEGYGVVIVDNSLPFN